MNETITDQPAFIFHQGTAPLLISIPHVGLHIPSQILANMTYAAAQKADTDWHLDQLYAFAKDMGASILQATHSRYVIDLNRPPDNASLYPGMDTTSLCPIDTALREPLYQVGCEPTVAEIVLRRDAVWLPYHQQLQNELARLKALHGRAVLWDAHSIKSVLPRFFEGQLPDVNIGTNNGASCDQTLANELLAIGKASSASGYTSVMNGRFKGGYITRQYGKPADNIHAVQLELTQCCYMNEAPPFEYLPKVAAKVQPVLQAMLQTALQHVTQSNKI